MTPANVDNIIRSSSMDPRFRGDDEFRVPSIPVLILRHGSQPSAG